MQNKQNTYFLIEGLRLFKRSAFATVAISSLREQKYIFEQTFQSVKQDLFIKMCVAADVRCVYYIQSDFILYDRASDKAKHRLDQSKR